MFDRYPVRTCSHPCRPHVHTRYKRAHRLPAHTNDAWGCPSTVPYSSGPLADHRTIVYSCTGICITRPQTHRIDDVGSRNTPNPDRRRVLASAHDGGHAVEWFWTWPLQLEHPRAGISVRPVEELEVECVLRKHNIDFEITSLPRGPSHRDFR